MSKRKPTAALEDAPVIHPLLLAVCPILGLYAYNVVYVSWTVLVRPILVALVVAEALLLAFWLGLRDKHKAGILTSAILLALMWGWSVLESAIEAVFPIIQAFDPPVVYGVFAGFVVIVTLVLFAAFRQNRRQALVYAGVFLAAVVLATLAIIPLLDRVYGAIASALILAYVAGVCVVAVRLATWNHDFKPWTRTANWFSLILVVLYTALIIFNAPRDKPMAPPSLDVATADAQGPETLPDVYLLLVEGYARWDVLLKVYSYNDVPVLESLQESGFRVESKAFSNYAWDLQSAASLLNMDYLDALMPADTPSDVSLDPVIHLYHNNRFFHVLQDAGYEIMAYSPGVQMLEPGPLVDRSLSPRRTPFEFEVAFLQSTACKRLMELFNYARGRDPRAWQLGFRRARVDYVFDSIGDVAAEEHATPRLVFAHIPIPEPPFMFERKGEWVDPRTPKTMEERYLSQLHYTSKRMTHAVRQIEEKASRPAIVMLVSAQGPGLHGDEEASEPAAAAEHFGVLLASEYPEELKAAPSREGSVSLVNVLRGLLNRVFDFGLPMLEDKALMTDPEQPLAEREVSVPLLESAVAPTLEAP
jgi:hypothetical protein